MRPIQFAMKHSSRYGAAGALLLAILSSPQGVFAEKAELVYSISRARFVSPNSLFAMDVVGTPEPELLVTDVEGFLRVYNGLTGLEISRVQVASGLSLTAPVVGAFKPNGALDIAVGTSDGRLILISGSNFEILSSTAAGSPFSIQPMVFTPEPDNPSSQDILVMSDNEGRVLGFSFDEANRATKRFEYSSSSRMLSPPTFGSPRRAGQREIIASTNDGYIIIVNPEDGTGEKILIRQPSMILRTPLLADIDGDGKEEVILVLESGDMLCLTYQPNALPRLQPVWTRPLTSAPVSAPILIEGPNGQSVILQATLAFFQAIDLRTGTIIAEEKTTLQGINTELAVIPTRREFPEVAFGLKQTIQITQNLGAWISSNGRTFLNLDSSDIRSNLTNAISVVRNPENDQLLVVGLSPGSDGTIVAFNSKQTQLGNGWPTNTPWQTAGGGASHRGRLDVDEAALERARRNRLQENALLWRQQLDAAIADKDWEKAADLSAKLVNFDPFNTDYQQLQKQVFVQKNRTYLIITGSVLLIILVVIGWRVYVVVVNRKLYRQGIKDFKAGQLDSARESFTKLAKRKPRDPEVAGIHARTVAFLQDYSEDTIPIYAAGHQAKSTDRDILHAYTRALLLEPKTDEVAKGIYEKAAATFPEPALIEYALGRCALAKRDYDEAGQRIRAALRGGVTSQALYNSLCEVYLETKNTSAKALPIYQQQFESRKNDLKFLKAYLASCIDAKKLDNSVESLCHAIIDQDHDYIPAHLHLASIYLQKNQPALAADSARDALRADPNSRDATILLANCLMVLGHKDDESISVLRKAASLEPDDREIHKVLTDLLKSRGDYSKDAVAIYTRANQLDPEDLGVMEALAQAAERNKQPELAKRALEALAEKITLNAASTVQLGRAYVALDQRDARAEKVLRDALRVAPDDEMLLRHMGQVLCALDRQQPDIIPYLERYLAVAPQDVVAGRQLSRAYIKNERYEEGLATTTRFLQIAPDDRELEKLHALASLYDNKIDEAISEYESLLRRNPNDHEALVNLAMAFARKQRTDEEAEKFFEKALAVQPNSEILNFAHARTKLKKGDSAKAIECYKQVLRASPEGARQVIENLQLMLSEFPEVLRLRWFLVENLINLGLLREALEHLDFIEHNHPGQTSNILRALETILARDPNSFGALLQRGSLLHATAQLDEAMKMLEKAHSLKPAEEAAIDKLVVVYNESLDKKDSPTIRFKLGKLFYAQREYDAAIGCFQKTAQDYRWEGESTKMLGRCFSSKGMLDLALQEYKKLVVDNETKDLLYELAQRYEQKKDLVGAKTVYRQLFAADIDYKDVRSRFEMLSGSTSDPIAFEKTAIVQQMSDEAVRRYELLDELGRGAMGLVYRAKDKELEEVVALKILPDNMSNNPEAIRRFKIEARNARKLSHPNIVRIHDIGEEMGRKYISMEYVDGSDLKKRIKAAENFRLPLDEVIRYTIEIADAMAYAHRLGIVHRDIKPANIMLTSQNVVKVTDFGIAKMIDSTAAEGTMMGAVIGTPLYMSPEQVQGIPVDNRADLYSFGVMLYEMISGKPPFTDGDLAYQHVHSDPARIDGISDELWDVVAKCLAKKKEDRWENAEQIIEALKAIKA